LTALCAVVALAMAACSVVSKPEVSLDLSTPTKPVIVVNGLSRSDVEALAGERLTNDAWAKIFRVSVLDAEGKPAATPLAGAYALRRGMARFTPMYPLDPGRKYQVVFGDVTSVVSMPADAPSAPTSVATIYPSSDTVPANLLRMYVAFSGPMGSRDGEDYVKVADATGRELDDALLPLNTNLWNDDRTRFTVLFDPGRVKRGILPNRRAGRPLSPGMTFVVNVRRDWPDAHGHPLVSDFRRTFRVGAAIERPLDPGAWQIIQPQAKSKEELVVRFPWPLDRALLARSLQVWTANSPVDGSGAIEGTATIDQGERGWRFTPAKRAWLPGTYTLVALPELEDVCGNRVGRAFETLDSTDDTHRPPARIPFTITGR